MPVPYNAFHAMTTTSIKTFHFPEVRIVEASAGSGKTYALAKRYVQLLMNPRLSPDHVPVRNILAITFTNKAALEMKARILDFLKRIALGKLSPEAEKDILVPIHVTPEAAGQKAYTIMEEVIHHYNFFQVQTIDSFINALLAGCSFKIGLSANFQIKRNYSEYLEYSLDQLIAEANHDKEIYKIFERFLHQYLFLENKTGWFPKEDMLLLLDALYQQSNTYGLDFIPYALDGEHLIVKKRQILTSLQELYDHLPAGTDKRFVTGLEAFLKRYQHGFDIDRISDYFNREEIPVRKGVEVSESVEHLWRNIRRQLQELSEAEAYSLFNPYIEVFEQVMRIFHQKAMQDDVLFLSALNRQARALFEEGAITVEELYYRLATRFHHYLVDEFQDTSVLQWRNFFLMMEEALSTGGSVFYVGDKKQAIYGFRGGEARLFEHVKTEFVTFNVQTERLEKNYRSQKAIVDFNNHVFSLNNLQRFIAAKEANDIDKKKKDAVILGEEGWERIVGVFGSSQQEYLPANKDGIVRVEYIDQDKKEERNTVIRAKVIALIQELKGRTTYREIAILTRSNQEVEELTTWLMEEGIPVESERTLNIKENFLIRELLSFLKFLNSPIDNLAFMTFMVGEIFTRASGLKKEDMHQFLFGLREEVRARNDFYIYKKFRDAFPGVWESFLDIFFKNVGFYPLYELAVSIIHRLQVLVHFPDQQGFVMRLLEVIKLQEEETTDLATFLEYFENLEGEELYVNIAKSDAIRLLTVHKSKGLEFPVVIVPFLEMEIVVGSGGNMGQQSYILDRLEDHLQLLRIKNKYLHFSEKLYAIRRREYIKSFLSELNNIYVVLTRAQRELYAFIPKKVGGSFNLAKFLIPEDFISVVGDGHDSVTPRVPLSDPAVGNADLRSLPGNAAVLPISQYRDWIEFLKNEFLEEDAVINRAQVLKGDILHALFSHIGNLSVGSQKQQMMMALEKTTELFPQVKDFADYRRILEQVISHPELKKFFFVEDAIVYQEKEIVNTLGHTKRIDRLIIQQDDVWVVDYKIAAEPTGVHLIQVRDYMEVIKAMHPQKRIRGFLIYLEEVKGEEVNKI